MANQHLKIFFMAVDGVGHINACIGLAQPLIKRGHEVIFLTNEFFSGTYEKFGFKEIVLKSAKVKQIMNKEGNQKAEEHPTKAMASVLKKFRDDGGDNEFANLMYESVKEQNPQLITLIDEEKPDLIIMDQFILPPCIAYGKIPWAFLCSACPRFLYDSDDIPPMCSGYPSNDRTGWDEFMAKMEKTNIEGMRYSQNLINKEFGYPELPEKHFIFKSPYMNIYGYPKELDYTDIVPLPDNYIRVDAFCREIKETFELPEEFKTKIKSNDKLIYLSMGSIGSIDVDLMKKLVNELSKSSHKFIISMGPLNDQYQLADNMWGQAFVPQTNVIPLVDLVITHGGNNTVTETFSFGKPMIVMPLFGDQYDNAQRILEKGFGSRIDPYNFNDGELNKMIDQIFANEQIQKRCQQAAERIAKANSKEKACEKIESIMAKLKLNVN
ncbi:NDP-glycosyltransferase YjiC isoform X2 [Dermatophagoides farinae]|uniref:NDP-glycosyltransferase YjiC isoform X2 n=1 Tax=Dermatophagoides farinae TaxID=6954 RepID=UPI003F62236A